MRPYLLALGLLATLQAQAGTLADVIDKAWLRLPQAQSEAARHTELQANQAAASTLFPGPPTLGVGYRSDRLQRNGGARDIEADVTVPLWLPGERAARLGLAEAETAAYTVAQRARRLALAGEVREAVWQVRLTENAVELAQQRLANAREIEGGVAHRVKAGDLARVNLLAVQSETLAAQGMLADAERGLAAARLAYRLITGDDAMPGQAVESPGAGGTLDAHPLLAAAMQRMHLAQAKARLVSETQRDNPELSLGARRERGDFNERYGNSIAVAVRIPLGTEARNAPRIAAAQAELAEAQAEYQRRRSDIMQTIQQAKADVDRARSQSTLAASRHALAEENLQLIKKAFSLGEKSLFDYQRTQTAAHESRLAAAQAEVELHRAIARLNQAQGVLP